MRMAMLEWLTQGNKKGQKELKSQKKTRKKNESYLMIAKETNNLQLDHRYGSKMTYNQAEMNDSCTL